MHHDPALKPGDRIPNFHLLDQENTRRSFYHELLGQPVLLLVCRQPQSEAARLALVALVEAASRIADLKTQIFGINSCEVVINSEVSRHLGVGFPLFSDPQCRMIAPMMTGAEAASPGRLFLLDQNQRIREIYEVGAKGCDLVPVLAQLQAMKDEMAAPAIVTRAAPVLLLPHVFDQAFCRELIDLWKAEHREGGFSTGHGNVYDASRKKTLEHVIRDPALHQRISLTLARRIGPELAKVFNYQAPFRFDVHIVMCYQPEREDFFGLHRDDLRPENKRRFALSLNLNDDFEGGELHFPEYSPDGYKPAAGTACVFSCPLLHEARPVTKGQRFVMTSFFCDSDQDAGATGVKQRQVRL